jgi:hypothetical protein
VLTLEKEYHIKRFTDRIAQGRESLRGFCGKNPEGFGYKKIVKKKKRICRQYIWKYKMSIYQGTYKKL